LPVHGCLASGDVYDMKARKIVKFGTGTTPRRSRASEDGQQDALHPAAPPSTAGLAPFRHTGPKPPEDQPPG